MRRICQVALLVVTAVVVGACAQPAAPDRDAGTPTINAAWTSCKQELGDPSATRGMEVPPSATTLPPLEPSFAAAAVIVCRWQEQARADGGQDLVAAEHRSRDAGAFLAALRLADEPPSSGPCDQSLVVTPWLALVDAAGRWLRPGVPTDSCGKPRSEVRTAIDALRLQPVSTEVVRESQSAKAGQSAAAAAKAGCSPQWADMVWVETTQGGRPQAAAIATDPLEGSKAVRVCVYDVPASERGSGKPAGAFASGGLLDSRARSQITGLLVASPAARDCRQQTTRFALLLPAAGGDPTVYVELDGCRRIMTVPTAGRPTLSQAGAGLVALLTRRTS